MYRAPLVPEEFKVPEKLEAQLFMFVKLTIDLCDLDYEAVMDNTDKDGKILTPNHTKHQNLIDLGYHQKEMQKKASFTYSILSPNQDKCLGCIYFYPSSDKNYNADMEFWVRNSEQELFNEINSTLDRWITNEWKILKIRKLNTTQ